MPEQQQQQTPTQAPVQEVSTERELDFEQERGNSSAQSEAGLDGKSAPPDDGKLRQAHGDHTRLREEALVAQKKLSDGIKVISGELAENVSMAKPLCDPEKIKGIERSNDKIDFKYGGDASRLTDIARGSIVFQDELEVRESFPHIIELVEGLG